MCKDAVRDAESEWRTTIQAAFKRCDIRSIGDEPVDNQPHIQICEQSKTTAEYSLRIKGVSRTQPWREHERFHTLERIAQPCADGLIVGHCRVMIKGLEGTSHAGEAVTAAHGIGVAIETQGCRQTQLI